MWAKDWSPRRIIDWAATVGPAAGEVVERILKSKPHPEMGYRSCLGLIRLAKGAGAERMEKACRRALHHDLCSYPQIKSILESRLDAQVEDAPCRPAPPHPNLRGADYYR